MDVHGEAGNDGVVVVTQRQIDGNGDRWVAAEDWEPEVQGCRSVSGHRASVAVQQVIAGSQQVVFQRIGDGQSQNDSSDGRSNVDEVTVHSEIHVHDSIGTTANPARHLAASLNADLIRKRLVTAKYTA